MVVVVWFIDVPRYKLTIEQEFFCWRYALHANGCKSVREAYKDYIGKEKSQCTKAQRLKSKEKIAQRCLDLIELHHMGTIDLRGGPWKHYDRKDVGNMIDTGNTLKPMIRDIREQIYERFDKRNSTN